MDILSEKTYKQSNRLSRYAAFPYYYNNEDKKYMGGITGWIDTDVSYVVHKVTDRDTLDSLALLYFGSPDYYWIIADFNRILDCYIKLSDHYQTLRIPSLTTISFQEGR